MTGPATPTGRRIVAKGTSVTEGSWHYVHENDILAIEAEARQQERERLRANVAANHGPGWFPGTTCLCVIGTVDECLDVLLAEPSDE